MADKWPLANGNWSNDANWNGGTKPVDGDMIYLDNRTVTLDETINLPNAKLHTTARSGGTAGGVLLTTTPTTANITLLEIVTGSSVVLNLGNSFTGTITIPTITGSLTSANINAITASGSAASITFTNCNFIGGNGANRTGLTVSSGSGAIVFVNCTATGGLGGQGVTISGGTTTFSGTLNLTNQSGATTQALGLSVNTTPVVLSGTCVMTGNVGLWTISNGSTIQYTCSSLTFFSALNASIAVFAFSTVTTGNSVTFSSPVTMHNQSVGPYLVVLTTVGGKVTVTGDVTAGTGGVASYVFNVTNGTVERVGEDICSNTVTGNLIAIITANSNSFYIADKIRCAAGGHLSLPYGPGVRFKSTSRIIAQDSTATSITLQPPLALVDLPIATNVRDGVTYNNGTQTGTMIDHDARFDDIDTEVAVIKAKTDQLVFTIPNQVNANALTGGGDGGGSDSIWR